MTQNDIEYMLDNLRRMKSRGDLNSIKIKTIEMELRFLSTFLKYHHVLLPDSLVKIAKKAQLIDEMLQSVFGGNPDECKTNLNVERIVSQLLEFIEGNTSLRYNFELNHSHLSEYMDCLDKNLNDVQMFLELDTEWTNKRILQLNRFLEQVKIIQKKMRFLRYLYATDINSCIDHEKLEGLETRIQFMADNVGQFCLALWLNKVKDDTDSDEVEDDADSNDVKDDADSDEVEDNADSDEDKDDTYSYEDENDFVSKPPYLLCLIVLVELEMKKTFLGEIRASKICQSTTFKKQKFPKDFSQQLHSLLVCLKFKKLKNFSDTISVRNINVAIELLLVFLAGVPNRVINGKRLNEVLEEVGALVGDVLCVIHISMIKDDTSKINLGSIQILEKTENLKAQLERYYKSLKFTPSQFPTVGGLIFLDSLLRKLNEMMKSELGLDFMMKPHIVILEKEFSYLTSVFRDVAKVQHEHEILKDLLRRTINLAYKAEVAIDSILAQCNALWYLFRSLPTILKEIKHISAEVTRMWSENLALKPCSMVEPSKHLPTQHGNLMNDEDIVGFKCHTDLYFLPFLMPEESRELLQKKVFQNEACPPELHDVSLDVARRCKGLPLVVVLVAGIIKKKKMERSWWHEVKKALFSYLDRESEDYSRATMQLIYDNLPDYLRPCLLYMGMFPEDERIPVSKLISLWIAEGFVQNIESGRLMEETAEGYLMDLISSNVVMVSKRRFNSKVKYCQVHDVVLHFCLERSREEKFMLAVRGKIQPSDLKESRVSFSFSNELSKFACKTRKPFHQHLRSLMTTNGGESLYWNPFNEVINLMRLLKVMDLSSHKLGRLSLATLNPLIHLKYVALFIYTFDFRGKSHLPHLETLILKCSMHTRLSENFWKMKKLRHVEFTEAGFFLGKADQ
ncbi:putative late blight resistance protein homolog R1B-11 [Nicotiana tomentosiformis]|uniref:putative late blight resistance protein homolog R1B-11 n=1 Tax=Nicotiana tomentosiformis TaxID=4098 RepID=UPI0008784F9B|nr:uncharacterized protein LOC104112261 [Nicotiana tomentosiformis]